MSVAGPGIKLAAAGAVLTDISWHVEGLLGVEGGSRCAGDAKSAPDCNAAGKGALGTLTPGFSSFRPGGGGRPAGKALKIVPGVG